MSTYTLLGMIIGGWAMLSLLGSERQRELVRVRRQYLREPHPHEPAVVIPPPPPAARTVAKPAAPAPAAPASPAPAKAGPAAAPKKK